MKNILIAAVLLVLAVGGIWYVRGMNVQTVPAGSPSPSSLMPVEGTSGVEEMVVENEVKEVVVEGSEFTFMPATLTLKKGEKIRLVFKNMGKMTHDWVVDELSVRTKQIPAGQEDAIEFTPNKSGTFEYYCSVGAHRANGMTGTLTVQ